MLQVELSVEVEHALVIVPAGLLGYRTSSSGKGTSDGDAGSTGAALMLAVPRLSLYLRLHDYFMGSCDEFQCCLQVLMMTIEMSLNLDTIRGRIDCSVPEKVDYQLAKRKSKEVLMIDGIDVVANRLFGPRPHTATYLCIWEISLGSIKASLSAFDAKILAAVGQAFGTHFVDAVNAPAEEFQAPIDPDSKPQLTELALLKLMMP
jgi:hypothetical protein